LEGSKESYCRFLELPKPLLLEGNMDDVSWFDVGLPYVYFRDGDYISPIHQWIERACSGACHPWHDLGFLSHFQEYTSYFSLAKMELPAYIQFIFYVSLFWFITKHKGRSHGVYDMLHGCIGYMISPSSMRIISG
jgi:hypothetical protein